jgi:uncharacterized sulfatase
MSRLTRRNFLQRSAAGLTAATLTPHLQAQQSGRRLNILYAMADDWSWPHASAYGDRCVKTPAFDRVAREGTLFNQAFCAAPQCAPNRASILTGRAIWQNEEAGTHGSVFPGHLEVYTEQLADAGYHVGTTGKPWGPGNFKIGGRDVNPAGPAYNRKTTRDAPTRDMRPIDYAANFEAFLEDRPEGAPFCFWYGAYEPHRSYEAGSGLKAGKRIEDVDTPPFLPDTEEVRRDILDYYLEVEWFDAHLGRMLDHLEKIGELENTLIVVTSDNGMPFPGAKANLFEYGTHMPLAIMCPGQPEQGAVSDELISFIDFAPTFMEAAGLTPTDGMTGKSLWPMLTGKTDETHREYVLSGRERHTHARPDNLGYPARAIRTDDYLYIWNVKPDRWPAGNPEGFHDIDDSPSKSQLLSSRQGFPEQAAHAVDLRPEHQLYSVKQDPGCMNNIADESEGVKIAEKLHAQLAGVLKAQGDPRVLGTGDIFESYPRFSKMRPELGGFAEQGEYNPAFQPKP